MIAEGHRLRRLQMRIAGHQGRSFFFGLVEQGRLQVAQPVFEAVDGLPDPELEVGRHLVVARAPGVQATRRLADDRLQAGLDIHVNVFQRCRKREVAAFDFTTDLL